MVSKHYLDLIVKENRIREIGLPLVIKPITSGLASGSQGEAGLIQAQQPGALWSINGHRPALTWDSSQVQWEGHRKFAPPNTGPFFPHEESLGCPYLTNR